VSLRSTSVLQGGFPDFSLWRGVRFMANELIGSEESELNFSTLSEKCFFYGGRIEDMIQN